MAEQSKVQDKPGTGVDRSQIRAMLSVTPAERLKMLVQEARNLDALFVNLRRK